MKKKVSLVVCAIAVTSFLAFAPVLAEEEKSDELESTKLLRMISKFIPLFTKIVGFLNQNIITLAAYRSSN